MGYEAVNAMLLNEFLKEHRKVRASIASQSHFHSVTSVPDSALDQAIKPLLRIGNKRMGLGQLPERVPAPERQERMRGSGRGPVAMPDDR